MSFWKDELIQANSAHGSLDLTAIHNFIEKVTVFTQLEAGSVSFSPEVDEIFTQYASTLAQQGLGDVAVKYARSQSSRAVELRHRLSRGNKARGNVATPSPWDKVNIGASREAGGRQAQNRSQNHNQNRNPNQNRAGGGGQNAGARGYQQQQQQHHHQQQHHRQQYNNQYQQQPQPASSQPQPTSTPYQQQQQLPPGWTSMVDPGSGRTYYANQQTGVTQWDPPPSVSAVSHRPANGGEGGGVGGTAASSAGGPTLANKYGDGFVSSASNPQLAAQYGNVGTANPYNGEARPAGANVSGSSTGTPERNIGAIGGGSGAIGGNGSGNARGSLTDAGGTGQSRSREIPPEEMLIVDGLSAIIGSLNEMHLTPSERKQVAEISKSYDCLVSKLSRSPMTCTARTIETLRSLVSCLNARDYATASKHNAELANECWKTEKDWLRGIKFCIQIASKKGV